MLRAILVLAALSVLSVPVAAHTGATGTSGLAVGFSHPLGGLDHVLAMVAVGLLAVGLGGRWTWALPAAFVGMMVLGGVAGMAGAPMPAVELGIQGSAVVLGLAIAAGNRCPGPLALVLVAGLALFHGHAHGTEMPAAIAAAEYGIGFAVATLLLHGAGLGLGAVPRLLGREFARPAGAVGGLAIAALGLTVLIG